MLTDRTVLDTDGLPRPLRQHSEPDPHGAPNLRRLRQPIRIGHFVMDPDWHEVHWMGRPLLLTRLEFKLLYALAQNAGEIVPYTRLVRQVWGYAEDSGEGAALLKPHISHLRRKLDRVTGGSLLIRAVLRTGYQLCHADLHLLSATS